MVMNSNLEKDQPNGDQVHLDKHISATDISDHNKDTVGKDLQKQKVGYQSFIRPINPSQCGDKNTIENFYNLSSACTLMALFNLYRHVSTQSLYTRTEDQSTIEPTISLIRI